MKFLPLIWVALRRKPVGTVLVCLSVTTAFTLFGLMIGLHATYQQVIDSARNDRLYVDQRFPLSTGNRVPLAMRDRIARISGVSAVGAYYVLNGYYQDPHNSGRITAVDKEMRRAWSELLVSGAQWDRLFLDPAGVLMSEKIARKWHLKQGDRLPFITPPNLRADGSSAWEFHVLAVVPDTPMRVGGFILGNYEYIDNSRLPRDRGSVLAFRVALTSAARANEISVTIDQTFANSGNATITIPEKSDWENAISTGISAASVTWPVAGAGLFMILLVTANGIAQSVRDRVSEFAVLSTIGFPSALIGQLVFLEAAFPCSVGGILGTAVASALTQWPARYLPQDLAGVPKPTLSPMVLVWAIAFALLIALISSAVPILRMRRLSVTRALAGQRT
jgi:putative ABC transport system permease protein